MRIDVPCPEALVAAKGTNKAMQTAARIVRKKHGLKTSVTKHPRKMYGLSAKTERVAPHKNYGLYLGRPNTFFWTDPSAHLRFDPPQKLPCAMIHITVVAAIIRKEAKILLGKRPRHKRHGGLWEFPGGKIDEGETAVNAITRELLEELGVETLSVGDVVYECRDPSSPYLIQFLEVDIRGRPEPTEHTEVIWCEPESLATVRLAPCDAQFVAEHLLRCSR